MPVTPFQDIQHGLGREFTLLSLTTAAGPLSVTSASQIPDCLFSSAEFDLNVTSAATEVGDTLDVYVDTSLDGGTTWVNIAHFTQLVGNGGAKREAVVIAPSGVTGVAPVNVAADAAAGATRHILGGRFRARYVQVDANANAAFALTLKMRVI